jgi:CheY-like chemotaxis protein
MMIRDPGGLFLIHWNYAEAEEQAERLRSSGWNVVVEAEDGQRAYTSIKSNPPAVIVIYLTRLPSHGRETAHALRTNKSTREIPIIFIGGQGEALEKTKAKVPVAIYTSEAELDHHLRQIPRL